MIGSIVVFMLLGWLGCTIVMTVRAAAGDTAE